MTEPSGDFVGFTPDFGSWMCNKSVWANWKRLWSVSLSGSGACSRSLSIAGKVDGIVVESLKWIGVTHFASSVGSALESPVEDCRPFRITGWVAGSRETLSLNLSTGNHEISPSQGGKQLRGMCW